MRNKKDNISESRFQKKIMQMATNAGLMARAVEWRGRRGCPDLVIIGSGHHLWIELKRPDGSGRVSPWQVREIERMRKHDVPVYVVADYDTFAELLTVHFPDQCG
jgi:hypothetical protein